MTEQTDAAEELARMIDSQIDGTIVSRAEHDPNCPGGGPECARLCPVRVQDYGDTTDLAAAILASDWYRQQIAAAEVRGAQAVLAAVEAVPRHHLIPGFEEACVCDGCEVRRAARAAAAVTTSSAKSSDLATRVPQDESQRAAGGGA